MSTSRAKALAAAGLLARLGLAAVWLVSGLSKAVDPQRTKVAVRAYQIFSNSLADTVAAVLPYLEIGLGVLLVLGLATRLVAGVSAVVLLAFIAGVISAAARGLNIDCGCFGGGGEVAAGQTAYALEILRDTGFLVLAAFLLWRPLTVVSVDRMALVRSGDRA